MAPAIDPLLRNHSLPLSTICFGKFDDGIACVDKEGVQESCGSGFGSRITPSVFMPWNRLVGSVNMPEMMFSLKELVYDLFLDR